MLPAKAGEGALALPATFGAKAGTEADSIDAAGGAA